MMATVNRFGVPRAVLAAALVVSLAPIVSAQQPVPVNPPPVQYGSPPVQAQPTQPQPAQSTAPPVQAAPRSNSILPTPAETVTAIGRFIDQSLSTVGAGVKGAGDTLGGVPDAAGDVAKGVGDAAGTIARLPVSSVVKGFERCPEAPNGAPDCEAASVALCRTKGFARGKSLDITSSYKCPAQLWREGRQPNDAECRNEAHVSQAMCQ